MDTLSLLDNHIIQYIIYFITIHFLKITFIQHIHIKFELIINHHKFKLLILSTEIHNLVKNNEIQELLFFSTI